MRLRLNSSNPYPPGRHAWAWEHVSPVHTVLDYGCNDGKVLARLRCADSSVLRVGVDLCEDAIRKGRETYPQLTLRTIAPGKCPSLPFPDAAFDRVLLLDVIEHIEKQVLLLRELRRVLKTDGVLIVTVPGKHVFSFLDTGNWKFAFPGMHRWWYTKKHGRDAYQYRYGGDNPFGLVGDIEKGKGIHEHFSRNSLRQLLHSAGFAVEAFDGTGFFSRCIGICDYVLPFPSLWNRLARWDAKKFQAKNLFCTARPAGYSK